MNWTELGVAIGQGLVPIVAMLLVAVIGALVSVGVAYIKKWTGVQIGKAQREEFADLAEGAVYFVEEQARKALRAKDPTPDSDTKMEMAVQYVIAHAKAQGLPEMARDRLVELIEANLMMDRPYEERVMSKGVTE